MDVYNDNHVNKRDARYKVLSLNVKLNKVQLFSLRATFHALPSFYWQSKFYTWPCTQVKITRQWKSTLRQHLQWVAVYYYIKSYPVRVYTPVTETPVSDVWRSTTRSTRGSFFLSQRRRWNHCFYMWTEALSQGFGAGVRVIRYSHGLIFAHKRVERFLTCQPRWRLYSVFYASQ